MHILHFSIFIAHNIDLFIIYCYIAVRLTDNLTFYQYVILHLSILQEVFYENHKSGHLHA